MNRPLTAFLYDRHSADREPVNVFDVGCSGGIGAEWNAFGTALRGTGFDQLESEIERLRAVETRPNLTYVAGWVGLKPAQRAKRAIYEAALPERLRDQSYAELRTSARRALQLTGINYVSKYYNAGQAPRYSTRRIAIDAYVRETGCAPDILKIDTDGAEMLVLFGAEDTIATSVLAVHVECRFQGSLSKYANNMASIDAFLRKHGLQMYAIEPFRYTRKALPGPFHYEMFAQTRDGQCRWADVVYLRDLAMPSHERVFGFRATAERVLMMAALMEISGLPDCAAELLQAHAAALPYPIDTLLDLLVPGHLGDGLSYRDYIARFEADPAVLLPSRLAAAAIAPPLQPYARPMQPIDLGRARSEPEWGAELRHDANGITVRTGAAPWAYAAFIPLPPGDRPASVELEVHGVSGRIGFTLAGDSAAQVSEHVWLDGGHDAVVVVLPVPDQMTVTGVIVRNAADGTPSAVTIASARLTLHPATAAPLPADRSTSGC